MTPMATQAKRRYGTGHVYGKHGSYYGRWRTSDGRLLNRKLGRARGAGTTDGLTRAQAEKEFRRVQRDEEARPRSGAVERRLTLHDASASLRRRLALEGARTSYLQNCESMERVHLVPALGDRRLETIKRADVEALATRMLATGRKPKTVRNLLTYLYSVFEHAVERAWCDANPVRKATRPRRRRSGDANPDLQFLTLAELDAVLREIPDEVVRRAPAAFRAGRPGPAPPPPPDVLGPVIGPLVLMAATTGLRQSELLGLRWRDVDWTAQRVRVRNAFVRREHSGEGKSDLSTRRSVPLTDRLVAALDQWSRRTAFADENQLVFAHPHTGNPLDRSKVTRYFQDACRGAGVRVVRFHDLRHTFGTQMAAAGVAIRTLQEWLGHAGIKTTQIYAHYAPSAHEVAFVNSVFGPNGAPGNNSGNKLSKTQRNSEAPERAGTGDLH